VHRTVAVKRVLHLTLSGFGHDSTDAVNLQTIACSCCIFQASELIHTENFRDADHSGKTDAPLLA
jgi:hypothetical protein